jgi:serine/threonine-protein kinase
MATLARDTLLGDRYRLSRRIAVGGMGEVWQAEDNVLHRTVAVKVLKSELTSDPASTFLERFRAEARTTAALSHPGIANVFDYGEAALDGFGSPQTAYLVMEFVDGEPLSAILARSGPLPVSRTLDLLGQTAAALDVAHRTGMVHRDVKPGNLLVRPDGVVKITDFGIARAADAVPLTQSGMVVGTAQYFSPEQAEGRVVTAASDVYSLGVVAYECLAGRLPFVADSAVAVAMMQIREVPPPLRPEIPAPVRALVARTMAKDPRARFATGGELAAAVRLVQQGRYDYVRAAPTPTSASGQPGSGQAGPGRAGPGQPGLSQPGPGPVAGAPAGGPAPRGARSPGTGAGPVPTRVVAPGAAGPSPGGPGRRVPAGPPAADYHPTGPASTPLGPGGPLSGVAQPGPVPHAPVAGPGSAAGPVLSGPPQSGPPQSGPPQPGPPQPGPPQPGPVSGAPPAAGSPHQLRLPPGPAGDARLAGYAGGGPPAGAAVRIRRTAPYRPPRWALLVAALVVLALVVAGGVMALLSQPSGGTGTGSTEHGSPSAAPSPAPTPAPITLDRTDYVGGDMNVVAARLRSLHLVPVIQAAAAHRAGRPGEVIDLAWRGELREGSKIIVIAVPHRGRGKEQ